MCIYYYWIIFMNHSLSWIVNDFVHVQWRHAGLMVSVLISRLSGLSLSLGWGHYVVFLGKTVHSLSASLHAGV